jgi:hypothetical protein
MENNNFQMYSKYMHSKYMSIENNNIQMYSKYMHTAEGKKVCKFMKCT